MSRLSALSPRRIIFGSHQPTPRIAVMSLALTCLCLIWVYPFLWMI